MKRSIGKLNHKKNSFLGDTYIKTKEGEIVIRAGMKLSIGWVIFALLCSCYVYAFFIRKPKIVPGENNTVELTIPENASYKKSDVYLEVLSYLVILIVVGI